MSTAGGPTAGVVLAGACWAWAAGTEDIEEIFHFYPLGTHCAIGSQSWGDPPTPSLVSSVLDKFVFVFR